MEPRWPLAQGWQKERWDCYAQFSVSHTGKRTTTDQYCPSLSGCLTPARRMACSQERSRSPARGEERMMGNKPREQHVNASEPVPPPPSSHAHLLTTKFLVPARP